ncbi:MAG TPA: LysR family transcriptional regulator [Burkholderiaceae bacterium]|nr:LysR family transcriptional regulator [Burkholderiaceae bacterium]
MDRVIGMQVFVHAISKGSLSAAGRHLGMSPAVATKHFNALEAHLGVKLVHRTTRRLSLTEAGSEYLEACHRLLPEIEEAEAAAASRHVEVKGLLRISMPISFGKRYIVPLIPAFSLRHPALRIELGLNDSVVDLFDGGWDMAIRIGRLGDSPLRARKLGDCPELVCAAPSYLDRRGIPRRVADLTQHNCLGYTLSSWAGGSEWAFGADGQIRVPVNGDLVANSGEALVAAAVAGQGLIYQPLFIVNEALARGELISLTLDQPTHALGGIHAVYPPDRRPPAKVRAMIDYLVENFVQEPWGAP